MESPCTLVCSIDLDSGYCRGCGRTGTEIGGWTAFSDAERRHLMQILPARLEHLPTASAAARRRPRA
jgi:predicted Fe-S protein YdhL (DUF1289 family)